MSQTLARHILQAAQAHEESFDNAAADEALDTSLTVDFKQFYGVSIIAAANAYCDETTRPLAIMLLTNCWNDALTWAKGNAQ